MAATIGIFVPSDRERLYDAIAVISNVKQQTLPVVQASYNSSLVLDMNVARAYALAMILGIVDTDRPTLDLGGIMRGAIKCQAGWRHRPKRQWPTGRVFR